MMKTMKAWQVRAWSEPEDMTLSGAAVPEPGEGEVRIRNRAAALNFFDILQIQGKYQVKPPFPFTPGAEVSGTVDAVGDGVTGMAVGASVLAMTQGGAFAEYSIAPAARSFPVPEGMDFAEAAAMPIVYHTSYFALTKRAALESGEWLLVHAGASCVSGWPRLRSGGWARESWPRRAVRTSWISAASRAPATCSTTGRRTGWSR